MEDIALLYKTLETEFGKRTIEAISIPEIITANLNPNLPIRPYQTKAFQYFLNYWNESFENKPSRHQLLFHMATGSGKTLMMAGLIAYLYDKGYRNFLFFVNSTSIIKKTQGNFFFNPEMKDKYLFKHEDCLVLNDKKIKLQRVDNFQSTSDDCINIAFSTIQGLHARLTNPHENSLTFDDFQDKKIVLISDEAHHINVETKAGLRTGLLGDITISGTVSKEEAEEIISWESTVNRIFSANKDNVLLEFTATVDFTNTYIAKKYAPRLVFDYPLKQFRIDGYSKDVKVLQSDASLFDRTLYAVLLSQYRRKVFEKNKQVIKPVLLFKSKTIAESKAFQEEFIGAMQALIPKKLFELKTNAKDDVLRKMFSYFEEQGVTLENLVSELKEDFSSEKIISVNSKEESEEKQLAINTLEASNNEYRVVFAVDKLNEGWDVLNLFDIVRLYDTRDAKNGKAGETTIREAQLIGRGARYCPFKLIETDELSKRKFDSDISNEMRICEELYYHSSYNPKYIQELNSALIKTGIVADKTIKRNLIIKDGFKETKFYKSGILYLNEQEKYNRDDVFSLPSSVRDTLYKISLRTGLSLSSGLFDEQLQKGLERKEKDFYLKEFNKTIIKKALFKLEFYSFSNLKKYFPHLESIAEFISNEQYLGNVKLSILGLASQISNLQPDAILDAVLQALEQISRSISGEKLEYRGSKEFKPYMVKDTISEKVLSFAENESEDKEFGKSINNAQETNIYLDLSNKSWHVFNDCFGTSEEKHLVKYIDKVYTQLNEKYDEIYLVRNERFFKLYNFDDGKPFEPDYVLFLYKKEKPKSVYYQVFIEPKGGHLKETDAWKQNMLISLRNEHRLEQIWEDRKYVIWGMPFYNNAEETQFDSEFQSSVL
jgi:type III restriction enzyme